MFAFSSWGSERGSHAAFKEKMEEYIARAPKTFFFKGRHYEFIKVLGYGAQDMAFLCQEKDPAGGHRHGRLIVAKCSVTPLMSHHVLGDDGKEKVRRDLAVLEMLHKRRESSPPKRSMPCFFIECLGSEALPVEVGRNRGNDQKEEGDSSNTSSGESLVEITRAFYLVSYWPVYNGGSIEVWNPTRGDNGYHPPLYLVARMVSQVFGTLHWMYNSGKRPIAHRDLHLGNVFMHFPGWDHHTKAPYPPNFYVADFERAGEFRSHGEAKETYKTGPWSDFDVFLGDFRILIDAYEKGPFGDYKKPQYPPKNYVWRQLHAIEEAIDQARKKAQVPEANTAPDLQPIVQLAQALEAWCGPGHGGKGDCLLHPVASAVYFNFYLEQYEKSAMLWGRSAYPVM
ncbi:hypothetical protein QBC42DRAFT_323755 [Cladorrhinum samala]|uniref:Protein kinase domain-containing protein n=1 Tax=Cladorrhinum samala TaxID=585594 RepID=A0AAV9HUC8_9PEZI|nr:hypothetical protein QBC42DRAFT_323755 [Cladorrhinum samala]